MVNHQTFLRDYPILRPNKWRISINGDLKVILMKRRRRGQECTVILYTSDVYGFLFCICFDVFYTVRAVAQMVSFLITRRRFSPKKILRPKVQPKSYVISSPAFHHFTSGNALSLKPLLAISSHYNIHSYWPLHYNNHEWLQ